MISEQTRFIDLPRISIEVKASPVTSRPTTISRVVLSFPMWLAEIDDAIRVLHEIEAWHAADPPRNEAWANPSAMATMQARETARVGSYVVFACALDRLIRKSFGHAMASLPVPDGPAREEYAELANAASDHISEIRHVRNKVFAHPAAIDPKKRDSTTMLMNSVPFSCGSHATMINKEFFIGGAPLQPFDEDARDAECLPLINIAKVSSAARACLDAWWKIIERFMMAVRDLDDEAYGARYQGMIAVRRPTYPMPQADT